MAQRGVNKVMLIGNLVRDPEIRNLADGKKVANFTVAISDSWKDQNSGQMKESTDFVSTQAWNGLANVCAEILRKGDKVFCEGRLVSSTSEKNGQKITYWTVRLSEMQKLSAKSERQSGPPPDDIGNRKSVDYDFDDSIPF